jgi:hypothetical protein
MKLEKREITLNEADSLKDIYYIEKALLTAYTEGEVFIVRKETENELAKLIAQTKEEKEKIYTLWQKSKKEQEEYT